MKEDSVDTLKLVRGSHLPVKVHVDFDSIQLKKAAVDKMVRYNRYLVSHEIYDYRLCYKNGETVNFIPGNNVPFILRTYKENVGLSYGRITLYLVPRYSGSDNDDDDSDDLPATY